MNTKTNIDEAVEALETALRILESDRLHKDTYRCLSKSSLIYFGGIRASISIALEKLKSK